MGLIKTIGENDGEQDSGDDDKNGDDSNEHRNDSKKNNMGPFMLFIPGFVMCVACLPPRKERIQKRMGKLVART